MPMLNAKLSLAKDVESLQRMANLDLKNISRSSTDQLCKSAKKLFDEDLVLYLKKKPDFTSNVLSKFLSDAAMEAMTIASELKTSLSHRYKSLSLAEKERENEEARADKEKEDQMKEGPTDILTTNIHADKDGTITAGGLFSILRDRSSSFLLIDVRSPEEFEESHIKHSSCVNVPKEILTPGLTAQQLEKQLPSITQSKWYQKNSVDYIITLDWDTATTDLADTHPLITLEKAMMKWDLKNPLTKKPLILIGGYKDWLSRYPMYATKAINVFRSDMGEKFDAATDLSSVCYPDLDDTAREEIGPKTVQQNTKLLSGLTDGQSQKSIIQNGWVIDPITQGTVGQLPSQTKLSKTQNLDSNQEQPTNSPKNQIPEFNRNLKPAWAAKSENFTKALHDEENAVKETLSVTEKELGKEVEFAQLRLRKELEAEETMRIELQKQEEHLLDNLKRLHAENEEKEKKYLALKEENTKMKKLLEGQKTDEQKEKEDDIQNIDTQKRDLQKEVERMRQERKQKERKDAENRAKCHSAAEYRTETDKSLTGKYRKEGDYTQPLKDTSSSSDGFSRGLTRSYSSPNIAQMVAEDDKKKIPNIDRTLKPKFDYVVNPNTEFKMRNLNAIFGNIPGRPVTGLRNLGNTCYMNSIIQCLSNTELLADYFNEGRHMKDIKRHSKQGTNGEIVEEFAFIIRFLWAGQYRFFSPKDFKNTASKYIPMCVGYEQQDSHEFLVVLMDKLHGDLNQGRDIPPLNLESVPDAEATDRFWEHHKLRNLSIMSRTFEGYLQSTLTCMSCGKKSNSYEVFSCLSLPISSSRSLKDSLQTFLKTEKMTGEGAWDCPSCRQKKDAEKSLKICKLPNVLIIQLKRFSYDGMWRKKIQSLVDFPQQFDVSSIYDRSRCYSLYGVVNHFGYLEGGHYTAICRNSTSGKWYKYDDHEVSEISHSDIVTPAAYLLFYSCQKSRL